MHNLDKQKTAQIRQTLAGIVKTSMKINFLTILVLLTTFYGCNSTNISTDKSIFGQIILDLNSDKSNDTILLLDPETSGDPGSFKRIRISGIDIQTFELSAKYAWDTIPKNLRDKNDPSSKTNFAFIKRDKTSSYILLTGWLYATGQEDFALIGVSKNQCTVLTKENFNDIEDFSDLNGDGSIDIALNPTWSEGLGDIDSLNASLSSYAPYFVYSLTPTSFSLDTGLTASYNSKNYVWTGLDSIQTTKVIWFRDKNKYSVWTD